MWWGLNHFCLLSRQKTFEAVMFAELFLRIFYGFMALGIQRFEVYYLSCRHKDTNVDRNHPQGDGCLMCVVVKNRLVLYMEKSERHQEPLFPDLRWTRGRTPTSNKYSCLNDNKPTGNNDTSLAGQRHSHTHSYITGISSHAHHSLLSKFKIPRIKVGECWSVINPWLLCFAFEQTLCLSFLFSLFEFALQISNICIVGQ